MTLSRMDKPTVSRRDFIGALAAAPTLGGAQSALAQSAGSLTDVGGIRVGHFTDTRRPTGCTVILFDRPPTAGVDYAGSAAAESLGVVLQPASPLDRIHGIFLTGGGAIALGATSGVVRFLEERARWLRLGRAEPAYTSRRGCGHRRPFDRRRPHSRRFR